MPAVPAIMFTATRQAGARQWRLALSPSWLCWPPPASPRTMPLTQMSDTMSLASRVKLALTTTRWVP